MPIKKPQHVLSDRLDHAIIQEIRRAYDEHLAYTDAEFGRLLDALDRQGLLDNTLLILTSDHGELFERGIRGHVTPVLFQPVIRVPLIISLPGSKERIDIDTVTSCVDILPTLLYFTNQQIPGWVEGKILPGITQNSNLQDRPIFAVDAKSNSKFQPLTKGTIAMLLGPYKLICYEGYPNYDNQFELFDLSQDPEELVNLSSNRQSLLSDMKAELSDQLIQYNHPNFIKDSH